MTRATHNMLQKTDHTRPEHAIARTSAAQRATKRPYRKKSTNLHEADA